MPDGRLNDINVRRHIHTHTVEFVRMGYRGMTALDKRAIGFFLYQSVYTIPMAAPYVFVISLLRVGIGASIGQPRMYCLKSACISFYSRTDAATHDVTPTVNHGLSVGGIIPPFAALHFIHIHISILLLYLSLKLGNILVD